MSGKCSTIEKSVEEILIDIMPEKFIFVGIQASSMGRLQASLSTGCRSMSRTTTEKRR
jgi:hypothetical protein